MKCSDRRRRGLKVDGTGLFPALMGFSDKTCPSPPFSLASHPHPLYFLLDNSLLTKTVAGTCSEPLSQRHVDQTLRFPSEAVNTFNQSGHILFPVGYRHFVNMSGEKKNISFRLFM